MAKPRVLVAGMIARVPDQGGATWAVLQYLLGLRRLGCDVHFVEWIERDQGSRVTPLAATRNARYCAEVMRAFDIGDHWTLLDECGEAGTPRRQIEAWTRDAEVLLDLSGVGASIPEAMQVPVRVYVDLDPGFTQAWHVQGADVGLGGHTHHVTVGTGLAAGAAPGIPDCGVRWEAVLPPVVLHHWPLRQSGPANDRPFSTVGNWRSYGPVSLDGMVLGQRAHSFRSLLDLPRRSGCRFRVALSIHPGDGADRRALCESGWEVVDPLHVVATPDGYREFIGRSLAEIGVAKHGYVVARTGWLSDRTACYLASGRPVVAQDTGLVSAIPTGRGLVTFDDIDGAVDAVHAICRDYKTHARAARAFAVEHLDSDIVLSRLLSIAGATP